MKDWIVIFYFAIFCLSLLGAMLPLWLTWWDEFRAGREKKEANGPIREGSTVEARS
jgi:hypothetical protein